MSDGLILSPDQAMAVEAVLSWYRDFRSPQRFVLGGYAGTGKTTIIKEILALLGGAASVCAFTGKAASVLRAKGIKGASTIHRLIYVPEETCLLCGSVVIDEELKERVRDQDEYCSCPKPKTKTEFYRIDALSHPLVIVDEASMVSREIMADLESFGTKVLYVGDHGQLEPVVERAEDDPKIMQHLDVRLEQIHRQAESSPIIRFAHDVRLGKPPRTTGPEATVVSRTPDNPEAFDIVLAAFNKTRVGMNAKIRKALGYWGDLPCLGERIVCLRNQSKTGLFNGMLATVTMIDTDAMTISIVDDLGDRYRDLDFEPGQFGQLKPLRDTPKRYALFDFGYCLTVHKFQGSEADRVLVLEEPSSLWAMRRWRYTAATRAAKELVYRV